MGNFADTIIQYISIFLAVLIVLPLHEFAHALIAVKCGDNTPKINGRLTLNPLAHFDLIGLVCFVVAHFGWAKPVPINPYNFNHPKRDLVWVSIAGVLANYILAFIAYPLYILAAKYLPNMGYFDDLIKLFLYFSFSLSLSFCVFNLLPIYPLDGFRVLDATVNHSNRVFRFLRNNGQYILIGLILLGVLADITNFWFIDILGIAMNFLVGIISKPITLLWGLIF